MFIVCFQIYAIHAFLIYAVLWRLPQIFKITPTPGQIYMYVFIT